MFFFFQAEDGIRDLVRSRGLGDVYKRQALFDQTLAKLTESRLLTASGDAEGGERRVDIAHAVSYTHLTLPTSDLV